MNTTSHWTTEAEEIFSRWLDQQTPRWQSDGADPIEVASDLRSHLEARFEKFEGNGAVEMRAELDAITPNADPVTDDTLTHPRITQMPTEAADEKAATSKGRFFVRWARALTSCFGWVCIFPALVIISEVAFDISGGMFFDPFARWTQLVAVVACVVIAGILTKIRLKADDDITPLPSWLAILRGAALVVCGYWTLLFTVLLAVGTGFYAWGVAMSIGIGLIALPIFVICALAAGAPLITWCGIFRTGELNPSPKLTKIGLLIGAALLILIEGPAYTARVAARNGELSAPRAMISQSVLLQMCYEGNNWRRSGLDTSGIVLNTLFRSSSFAENATNARKLYFLVTGVPFNKVEAPSSKLAGIQRGSDMTFDSALGGDTVAARLPDLDLTNSRIDGHVDAASGLGYWEWTMEFTNSGTQAREARMQVLLPSEGVVSRLTLWVNDEPREAAFSSTKKVAAAYKSVAVVQRRDPVLVRWLAPDRVLVQCFPVPGKGTMRIRLGITAPVANGTLDFPSIIERNYSIDDKLATTCWIQGDCDLQVAELGTAGHAGKHREIHGELPIAHQVTKPSHVTCSNSAPAKRVWTTDPFADGVDPILVRTELEPAVEQAANKRFVAVVDTSHSLGDFKSAIADSLEALANQHSELKIFAASDEGFTTVNAEELRKVEFVGGKDVRPALQAGITEAIKQPNTTILWFGGVQPESFSSTEPVSQLLERAFNHPTIAFIDCAPGANHMLENVAKLVRTTPAGRVYQATDIASAVTRATQADQTARYKWASQANEPSDTTIVKVWDQLARWKAWEAFADPSRKLNAETAAIAAAKHQLVTPYSGAVVLETKEQYDAHGLEAVDASTTPSIPNIPEPSSALLALVGGIWMLMRRQRAA